MDFREAQKVMRFHTDDSLSDRGFHIAVRQNECGDRAGGGGATPGAEEQGDCDESFQKPEAMLVSVNYPSNYGNNLDCRYTQTRSIPALCAWLHLASTVNAKAFALLGQHAPGATIHKDFLGGIRVV
ncbi:hypothetical protein HPB48_022513 [Haemaphysalis longicornis]|uniref:CUB domain-containing protein n=1 Tax=Haemaphysalis longicornis TaxID=44386 RepID=A0A9J6FAD9_HAELO|nr:hypothetical protein HPB48_022513 [Haemaphysalis longicornis]